MAASKEIRMTVTETIALCKKTLAATAALLNEGIEFGKHTSVISFIHKQFVKTGRLS